MMVIKDLIFKVKSVGIFCFICGDVFVLYLEIIDDLIWWGIIFIFVNLNVVEKIYKVIVCVE